jgi:hypothetical protein
LALIKLARKHQSAVLLFMDFEDSVDNRDFMALQAEYSDIPAFNALAAHGEE